MSRPRENRVRRVVHGLARSRPGLAPAEPGREHKPKHTMKNQNTTNTNGTAPTPAGHIIQPVTPAQVADARKKLARLDYEAQAWGGTAEDMPESEALYAIIARA